MSRIEIKDLNINYGAVTVLKDLQLEVKSGEFVVLLGPSGCGKSTLLNAIAGLTEVSDGTISINEKDVTDVDPSKRGLAMVFQAYALYPNMTVRGNLSYGLKVAKTPKTKIERRVAETAQFLQIAGFLDRKPAQLSGGQRQRVAIGRAIVRHVDVFLFDEPLSNLDAKLRSELRVEIKRLHRALKSTIVYVTHDQVEALTLADRMAVMKGGKIQQLGTPAEIYRYPINRFVASFIGSPTMNFIEGTITIGGVPRFKSGELSFGLQGYEAKGSLQAGMRASLGFRPEHLEVGKGREGAESFMAEVDRVEPMGGETVVWAKVGSQVIAIKGDETLQTLTSGPIELAFHPEKLSLFDENGDRL